MLLTLWAELLLLGYMKRAILPPWISKILAISMGAVDTDNSNLVQAALDAGIAHLDTAPPYQGG